MFRVALYQPQIPQNTGNISRLCVGAACSLVLVEPLGFALDDRQVRRAGLDHWPHLDLQRTSDVDQLVGAGRVALFSKYGRRPYWEHHFAKGDLLLFGSETTGLPAALRERFPAQTFSLPMPGPVRSINLSNSVAIVVYEGLRQLAERGLPLRLPRPTDPESFDLKLPD